VEDRYDEQYARKVSSVGELGDLLRTTREEQNLSIEQVEEITRIRHVFLEALEDERFEDLPGGVYARGFLRTYGRLLGLDPEELMQRYRRITHTTSPEVPQILNEPLMPRSRSSIWPALFVSVMLLAVLGLIGWYLYNRLYLGVDPWPIQRSSPGAVVNTTTSVSATRDTERASTTTPSLAPSEGQPTPTVQVQSVILPTRTPTPAYTSLPSPTPRPRVTRTATPTNSPTPTERPTFAPDEGIRVAAQVVAPTYIEVTLDGTRSTPVILQSGEDQIWEAQTSVALRIGNAAGIQLSVNGVDVGSLGASGQVIDVEYTVDNLP
jgi:cytoskeleton protein RodZ